MKKVICYIDGYNVYHHTKDTPSARIDFYSLCNSLLLENQSLKKVHYFSALARWKHNDYLRHQKYISQLEKSNVTVTLSHFKSNRMTCKKCKTEWTNHKEKETDVRLALQIFSDATDDLFDTAFVFSGDGDMIPAIEMVKEKYPDKRIILVLPKHQVRYARNMQTITHGLVNLSEGRIKKHLFNRDGL